MRDRASRRAGDAAGLEVRSLPGRYPLSLAHRRTADGARPRIVSNHPRETYGISISATSRFTICRSPATPSGTGSRRSGDLLEQTGTDLVVLARYMQILSDGFVAQTGRAAASTSITRFCRASRARSRTTRPMSAASS